MLRSKKKNEVGVVDVCLNSSFLFSSVWFGMGSEGIKF